MKRCALLASFLFMLLTGCGATQVRDRAYVQSVALSQPETPTVSLHLFEEETAATDASGSTLSAALEQAEVPLGRALFMGHVELICLEDAAFGADLSDFRITHRLSPSCKIVSAEANVSMSDVNTENLLLALQQEEENGRLPETDLLTVLMEFSGKTQTALIPMVTENGFSLTVCSENRQLAQLSQESALGLCWLRGQNLPARITVSTESGKQDVEFTHSYARLTADVEDTASVTLHITLSADIDDASADALQQELTQQCETAWQETVRQLHADVIGLSAVLNCQCYSYAAQTDWDTICETVAFTCEISIQ